MFLLAFWVFVGGNNHLNQAFFQSPYKEWRLCYSNSPAIPQHWGKGWPQWPATGTKLPGSQDTLVEFYTIQRAGAWEQSIDWISTWVGQWRIHGIDPCRNSIRCILVLTWHGWGIARGCVVVSFYIKCSLIGCVLALFCNILEWFIVSNLVV